MARRTLLSNHRWRSLLALLMLVAVFVSCSSPAESRLTPSPAKAAVDYAAMETMIENKISSGSLSLSTINAVLVSVDGETKVAHYRNGSKPEDALHVVRSRKALPRPSSASPSRRRSSAGWSDLARTLPRYGKYLTAEEKSITLRQLMSMTAGFPSEEPGTRSSSGHSKRTDPIPAILTGGLEAARRSLQLFESWRASRVRRATGSPGSS